jgi:hypothetical protein
MDLMATSVVSYKQTSPYYGTPLFENGKFLDLLNYRNIPRQADDMYSPIPVVYNLRPDLMANDLYGDSHLWWVFAVRNPNTLLDPLWDFVAGTYIYLPKKSTLQVALGT